MTDYAIPIWTPPAAPVTGGAVFPVRHIYCVGRNYAAHAREMGTDPDREPPFFFTKAADSIVPGGGRVTYPPRTESLHHEVEMVVAIGGEAADIGPHEARAAIFGYAVGIDLTRRDLQQIAKDARRPWDVGKSFAGAAPIGEIHPVAAVGHPRAGAIEFAVNGETRQRGDLAEMIWSVEEIIAELSTLYTILPGDLIFTGTPSGVGPLEPGDHAVGRIEGVGDINIEITAR